MAPSERIADELTSGLARVDVEEGTEEGGEHRLLLAAGVWPSASRRKGAPEGLRLGLADVEGDHPR